MLKREECAGGMGQRGNFAAVKDVLIMLSVEECVGGTVQNSHFASVEDAQI